MITLHCRPPGEGSSEIRIGRGIATAVPEWARGRRVFAFVDVAVASTRALDPGWPRLVSSAGEGGKTLAGCETVLRAMAQAGIDRDGLLVVMGGGALGDVGGLAASLFLRGIEAWQVPTTLLAMVDSSVGGKTAVNLPEGKNLVGTVHPASRVIVDLDFVASLSGEQFHSGLAEVLKIAIGLDVDLLLLLERERTRVLRREIDVLIEIARRAIAAKIAIVEADPRDHGPRRLLNLGHTLGHALEAHAGFTSPHGHCVARGLHFALELAADLGELSSSDRDRCASLLVAYGHERTPLPPADELTPFLRRDKKMVGDRIHFVMPTAIGRCTTRDLDLTCLARQLRRG